MKFKIDMQYFKIAVYAVLSLTAAYALFKLVDSAAFILTNAGQIAKSVGGAIGWLGGVFSVAIIAFVIAYVLDPLVEYFERKYENVTMGRQLPKIKFIIGRRKKERPRESLKHRTAGTVLTYALLALIIAAIVIFIVLRVGSSSNDFAASITNMVSATVTSLTDFTTNARLTVKNWGAESYLTPMIDSVVGNINSTLQNWAGDIINKLTSIGGILLNLLMAFVVAFYFLRDKQMIAEKAKDYIKTFFTEKWRRRILNLAGDLHAVFSGYIRGQLIDASIMGCLISLGLSIVGLDLAVLIGIFAGLCNLIPYFGAIVGFLLAVGVALLSGNVTQAVMAGIIVIVLQQIDGIFINPRVVGRKVELTPPEVLLSLSIAGALFGLWGMVFAVPVCALLKIIIARFTERRKLEKMAEGGGNNAA